MKAGVIEQTGALSKATIKALPGPRRAGGDVLVAPRAVEANHADILYFKDIYRRKPDLRLMPGLGGSGLVKAVDPGPDAAKLSAPAKTFGPRIIPGGGEGH